MSVGQSKGIRARQGKANGAMQRTDKILADRWRDIGTDFEIKIDGKPLEDIPTKLFVNEIDVETGAITEVVYTSTIMLDEPVEPLSEDQQKLADWWAKKFEEQFLRDLLGQPSEYEHSLRAAGAKV